MSYLNTTASTGQLGLLATILTERVVPADAAARLTARIAERDVTVGQFRTYLDYLKAQPKIGQTTVVTAEVTVAGIPSAEVVPAGRYAVATEAGAVNELAFYRVDRPTEGKWAGKVFVKLMRSDEEQRMSFPASKAVLAKIAAVGAQQASAAYGQHIGSCGVCGRTLTNDESREIGIGPDCRARLGW